MWKGFKWKVDLGSCNSCSEGSKNCLYKRTLNYFVKVHSDEVHLTHVAVSDSCIVAAEIGNFLFFARTLLPQLNVSNTACMNPPLWSDIIPKFEYEVPSWEGECLKIEGIWVRLPLPACLPTYNYCERWKKKNKENICLFLFQVHCNFQKWLMGLALLLRNGFEPPVFMSWE